MPDIRDRYTLDASQYLNSMQRVVQATKAQADMAKEASYQATLNARRTADAAREAARVQKTAIREATEAEKIARKENTDAARQAAEAARQRAEQAKREYEQQAHAAQRAREAELRAKEAAHEATRAEREATEAAKEQARVQKELAKASEALSGKIKGLVTTYISLQSVAKLVQLSDEYSSINAKLGMMEDRLESTKAMQDAIMASAKRSRASYMDTANLITRIGTMASDAFDSFDELVAFSEQINKNLVLSGASASEASEVTQQLSQALASGALRGDELGAVLERGSMIAERIADYLDVDKGKIRELASEGLITAEIVKNAMLETAEKTNEAFENMPMTWSQVWTEVTNTFIEYSQPLLEIISFLAQHFDALIPVLSGVAAALVVYAAGQAIAAAATLATTIATNGLWATIMANPLGWIAVAIGLIVGLIVVCIQWIGRWVKSVGGLKIAWLIAVDKMMTAGDYLINFFRKVGEAIVLVVAGIGAVIAELVQNAVNGAIRSINRLIQGANFVIGLVRSIPGVPDIPNIPLIPEVGFGDAAMDGVGKLAGYFDSINADAIKNREDKHSARIAEIEEAKAEAVSSSNGDSYDDLYGYLSEGIPNGQSLLGAGTGNKGKNGGSDGTGSKLGKIASDTADIKKSVDMTHEDLSLLVDMATRKYVANVNLETRAPVINITGQNTGDSEADAMRIADELKRILLEQMSAGGSLSYALP